MNLSNLPFNWVDLVAMGILIVGLIVGRKKGMSEELLPVFQWLAIVVVGALYYQPAGRFLSAYTHMSLLMAFVVTYLANAVGHILFFSWVKRLVGEKLVEGDLFGAFEYYLGMVAGAVRYLCILMAVFALLHARYISPEQLAAEAKTQRENFGSVTFPTLGMLQQAVFQRSATGRLVKKYLNEQLIEATPPNQQVVKREGVARRRERAVNEVLGK
ncbi:MAG: CvpA family protein [Verrucomicrobia bacterium]|nr:CvpA family protein [Verrucomicrobiota bacterium]